MEKKGPKGWRRRGRGSWQSADGGGKHLSHASAKSEAGDHRSGHDDQHGAHAAARVRGASSVARDVGRCDVGRCKPKTSGWSCQGTRGGVG